MSRKVIFEHARHVKMWEWLALHPTATREMYLECLGSECKVYGSSYACDCALSLTYMASPPPIGDIDYLYCAECPLQWPSSASCRMCSNPSDGLMYKIDKLTHIVELTIDAKLLHEEEKFVVLRKNFCMQVACLSLSPRAKAAAAEGRLAIR